MSNGISKVAPNLVSRIVVANTLIVLYATQSELVGCCVDAVFVKITHDWSVELPGFIEVDFSLRHQADDGLRQIV